MLRGIHRCIDCAEEIARRYQTECRKIQNHQDGLDCFFKLEIHFDKTKSTVIFAVC